MKLRALIVTLASLLILQVTASAVNAKANWMEHCSKCHGDDGRGQTKIGKKMKVPDFTTKQVQNLFTDEQAFKIIKNGLRDDNDKVSMLAVEGLNDDEIRGVITFLRTLKK